MAFPSNSTTNTTLSRFFVAALLLAASLFPGSCAQPSSRSGPEKRYELRGRVVSVDRAGGTIEVEHDAVPGLMEGMTMSFGVRDADALRVAAAGDQIQAALVVGDDGFWLENLVITKGSPAPQDANANSCVGDSSGPREPSEGDEVPDFKLINQDGEPRRLGQYRGRALLLTFIYTRCPDAQFCPLISSNFAEVSRELEKNGAQRDGVHLLSVTIDPEHDTPRVLRSYGAAQTEKYSAEKFERWEFATGEPAEIRRMANFFGLTYNAEKGQIVHSLRTVVIGADGRVFRIYRGNEWKASQAVADLERASVGSHASR